MEKCGCNNCVLIRGTKAIYRIDYNVKDCPCRNCLVKVLCNEVCNDILDYTKNYKRGAKGRN